MAKTAHLELPLVAPAQAQKHVTVNEALARLDAAAQLRVISSSVTNPPTSAAEGSSYLIPGGATGDWAGRSGRIAVRSNGGWVYLASRPGWRAWDESRAGWQLFDGTTWVPDALLVTATGAATLGRIVEFDHALSPGSTNATSVAIPNQALVIGVTARVVSPILGSGLSAWRLGVAGSDNRYGSGLGLALNSYAVGLSGSPVTYYADTPLLLTAEGGSFAAGSVRIAIHCMQLTPPRAV